MKIKASVFCILAFILLVGSINADAANVTISGSPANEPWTKELVDAYDGAQVGTHVAIAHHPKTGATYISYHDAENGDLWMAYEVTPGKGNCPNNDDWQCVLVDDSDDNVGRYSSIDVTYVEGSSPSLSYTKIGIAYYNATKRSLKYAECIKTLVNPPTWTKYAVDAPGFSTESRGAYISMKFDNYNKPAIGYHARNSANSIYGAVKVARYVESGGTGCNGGSPTWSCEIVDRIIDDPNNTTHGSYVSIDFHYTGVLFVAFFNSENNSLDYAWKRNDGTCSNPEWYCSTIDQGPGRGKHISLHANDSINDAIKIAYYDQSAGKIRYAERINTGDGNCTNPFFNCYAIDTVGTPIGNYGLSMAIDRQGYPIIAYLDVSDDLAPAGLKIARPALAYGVGIGNCGDQLPGDLFQYWTCTGIDNGGAYSDEAEFVGVSVSPAGLATVAYSEYNNDADESYLKVAKQHYTIYLPVIKN